MNKAMCVLFLLSVFPFASAFADHTGNGSVDAAVQEANELNAIVQQTYLRYPVKSAVQEFANALREFDSCSDDHHMTLEQNALIDSVQDHTGGDCTPQFQRAQYIWQQVERFLYDTNYDYPQVYQQYLSTRAAFLALNSGVPGGHPGTIAVSGSMNNLTFYFTDSAPLGIAHQCLSFGSSHGVYNVWDLIVNGTRQFGNRPLESACSLVSQFAR